jgi:hypothetical protein
MDDRVGARYAVQALRGFCFGAGFAVAGALVFLLAREITGLGREPAGAAPAATPARAAFPASTPAAGTTPGSQLDVRSQRLERRHGDNVVIGVLHNGTAATVRSVRVEAAHYDGAGRLVDVCGWYVATQVVPGEEKPFKVACGGTPERPAPESASVRLRLVDGY